MVFYWSLSASTSPQVTRTLLSNLVDLNHVVLGTVSTLAVISKSSSPCTNHFGDCTKNTNYYGYNRHLHVPHLFQISSTIEVFITLFRILSSLFYGPPISPENTPHLIFTSAKVFPPAVNYIFQVCIIIIIIIDT